jgi:hypothetical protein
MMLRLFSPIHIVLLACTTTCTEVCQNWHQPPPAPEPSPLPLIRAAQVALPLDLYDSLYSRTVHQQYIDENWEIFFGGPDLTTEQVRLTNDPADDTWPSLNPDSTQIAFVSDRFDPQGDIFVIFTTSGEVRRLTTDAAVDTMPTWSPDGRQILYVSDRTGSAQLFLMNADGTALKQISNLEGDNVCPTWSDYTGQITWVQSQGGQGRLWIMNEDGNAVHPLTDPLPNLGSPAWSPDAAWLGFHYDADGNGRTDIGVIRADGSHLQSVLNAGDWRDVWMGQWSRRGDSLLVTEIAYNEFEYQVYVQEIAVGYAELQQYQPDRWVVYENRVGGKPAGITTLPDWSRFDDVQPPVLTNTMLVPDLWNLNFSTIYGAQSRLEIPAAGRDEGSSGIRRYELAWRRAGEAAWTSYGGYWNDYAVINAQPGDHLFIRARVSDQAGNLSPWRLLNPHGTQFYASDLFGRLTDNRGQPFVYRPLSLSPVPLQTLQTDVDGSFDAELLAPSSPHILQTEAPGYAPFEARLADLPYGNKFAFYMAPEINLVSNGDFEANNWLTPAGWEVDNAAWVSLTQEGQMEGNVIRLRGNIISVDALVRNSSLSQQLTLPKDLHQPTLAWNYRSNYGSSLPLAVTVKGMSTKTHIFPLPEYDYWGFGWLDLSSWVSETITVTFHFTGTGGHLPDGSPMLYLDNISMGPWYTPVIREVAPVEVGNGITATLTITGENFITTPTVWLGTTPLVEVELVSTNTITAIIPMATAPGIYDIQVANPGGQTTLRPRSVRGGLQFYLPLVIH